MSPITIALISAVCIFSGTLIGLAFQRLLPGYHLNKETQDVVKLSAGTIATLTALVLGLLVSSAKNDFDTMSNGIVQSSAKIIILDRTLARYGPETRAAREQLKRAVEGIIEMAWPSEKSGLSAMTAIERSKGVEIVQDELNLLTPQNEAQQRALSQAQQLVNDLIQTRWMLIEQAQNRLPL